MTRNRSKDGVREMALAKTYRAMQATRPGVLELGERRVQGTMTGTPYEAEKTLDFSVLASILPRIETLPLERAGEAYARMKSGEARFRMVLTMRGAH